MFILSKFRQNLVKLGVIQFGKNYTIINYCLNFDTMNTLGLSFSTYES